MEPANFRIQWRDFVSDVFNPSLEKVLINFRTVCSLSSAYIYVRDLLLIGILGVSSRSEVIHVAEVWDVL